MKISRSSILVFSGAVLLCASLALEVHNIIEDFKSRDASEYIVGKLVEQIFDGSDVVTSDGTSNNLGASSNTTDGEGYGGIYNLDLTGEEDIEEEDYFIEVDGVTYCGIIEVPSVDVKLPVAQEYDYKQLKYSVCRYVGSLADRNMIICGHNNKSFFAPLHNVDEGDSVYFTNCRGITYEFVVIETQVVGGYEVRKMIEDGGDWDLTLFTCNYGGTTRHAVRCKLV